MTVRNPKQIQKIHKFLTPPFTTEVAVTPDTLKFKKQTTIFSFSPFFLLEFWGYMTLRMLFVTKPHPFHKGGEWLGQKGLQEAAVVPWPDESPVEQAGLRCLWLALTAVSSSARGLVALGFAEGKFWEDFPLKLLFIFTFPHFCDLMNVVLIPESRRGEAVSFLLLGVLYGGQIVTPQLAQSKSCFALGEWDMALLCVWRKL